MSTSIDSDGLRSLHDFMVFVARSATGSRQRQRVARAARVPVTDAELAALRAVKAHGPCTIGALAEVLGLDRTTVSRVTSQLEASGLVSRQADETDRRVAWIKLSRSGTGVLARLSDVSMNDYAVATSEWSPEEVEALGRSVERLQQCLSRLEFDKNGWAIALAELDRDGEANEDG